jgi:hypothetical protein
MQLWQPRACYRPSSGFLIGTIEYSFRTVTCSLATKNLPLLTKKKKKGKEFPIPPSRKSDHSKYTDYLL